MKPLILTILDGWGLTREKKGNAIFQAKTSVIDKIERNYPAVSLQASGIAVGMPWEEAGNSEVGHLTIGAGRVIYQRMPRILLAIRNGSFFKNPALLEAANHTKKNNSCLHFMGLVSSGNIHSYIDHLYGLIELAKRENIKKIRVHVFTDGKDAPQKEGVKIVKQVQNKLKELKDGKIATIMGRYYAMDREKNWDLIQKAYDCLTQGKGEKSYDPIKTIKEQYEKGETDTFIEPTIIIDKENKKPVGLIQENDSIVFFNFREDRARELTKAFVLPDFRGFSRKILGNICFLGMTQYEKGLPVKIAFPPVDIKNHLIEVLSKQNKKILKIAETEKYAHVTYFFNGGKEKVFPGERRILVPSKTTPHYDHHPEMSAYEITEKIIQAVNKNNFDFILVNYANPDMVGHTGNFKAAIKAAEIIDKQIENLLKLVKQDKCTLLITADHGNLEKMIDLKTGEPYPEHSQNLVPFYLLGNKYKLIKSKSDKQLEKIYNKASGILCDIAPTILHLMDVPIPKEMTGHNLLDFLI